MIGSKEFYLEEYCFEEYIKESQINKKVQSIAKKLAADYKGKNPIFVCVLDGAFIFLADLIRSFGLNCKVNFVKLSSYKGLRSSGPPAVKLPILFNIKGEDIIIVEDIIDSLINSRNSQKKRADLLQADLDKVDELHFDECQKLHDEIARLRLKINN